METTAQLPLWVQTVAALGPVLALTGVLVAAASVWWAARRERWWTRARWALDRTRDPDPSSQRLGIAVFRALVRRVPSQDERHIVRAASDVLLPPVDRARPKSSVARARYMMVNVKREAPYA